MKKKGFTLIELLAVIVVLAVILAIAVPRVISVIEQSRKDAFKISGELLLREAKKKKRNFISSDSWSNKLCNNK